MIQKKALAAPRCGKCLFILSFFTNIVHPTIHFHIQRISRRYLSASLPCHGLYSSIMIDKKWRFPASVQYSSQLCQTREICFHRIVQICISFIGQIIQYFKELLACVIFYFALSSLTAFLIIAPLIFFKVRLSFTIRLSRSLG